MTTCLHGNCTRKQRRKGYCYIHYKSLGLAATRIDPTRAHNHITYLQDTKGMSRNHIAKLAGVSGETISRIANSQATTISQHTEQKILAITKASGHPGGHVDAWPYVRRIQALLAIGYTHRELAEAFNIGYSTIFYYSQGNKAKIRRDIAATIRTLYTELARRPARTPDRIIARRNWAKPLDWDDIDNPDEHHNKTEITDTTMTPVTPFVIDRMNYCIDTLGGVPQFAAKFGIHENTVYLVRNRNQIQIQKDLWNRIYRFHYNREGKTAA